MKTLTINDVDRLSDSIKYLRAHPNGSTLSVSSEGWTVPDDVKKHALSKGIKVVVDDRKPGDNNLSIKFTEQSGGN